MDGTAGRRDVKKKKKKKKNRVKKRKENVQIESCIAFSQLDNQLLFLITRVF